MKVCDLATGLGMLQRGTKRLREAWGSTREHWRDQAASQFEEEHLQPLVSQITLTVAAVHRLADVLQQAEQACGDHERDA